MAANKMDFRPGTDTGNKYLAKQDRVRVQRGYHGRTIKGARELVEMECASTLGNAAMRNQGRCKKK